MTYGLITIGFILIIIGLILGLSNIDPKKFVAIAGTIGIIITGFGIFGKFFQDEKSGKTQNEILNNTISNLDKSAEAIRTATVNLNLSNKINTTTEKIDSTTSNTNELSLLADKNIKLLKEQQKKILELNNVIDNNLSQVKVINETQAKKLEYLKGSVTGGDSYLSILIYQYREKQNLLYFHCGVEGEMAHSPGKYPLTDVSIELYHYVNRQYELIRKIPAQTYGVNIDYDLGDILLNSNSNFEYYQIRIFTPKRNYWQHIFLKKDTDGFWYTHIIQDNEIYAINLRNNEFFGGYPEKLKKLYPTAIDYAPELMKAIPEEQKMFFNKLRKNEF